MNAMATTDYSMSQAVDVPVALTNEGVALNDTYWGYVIHNDDKASALVMSMQIGATVVGAAFLLAAVGLWVLPSAIVSSGDIELTAIASAFFAVMGGLFLRYASRGTEVEIQVDTNSKELREVVRNRAGRPSLLAIWPFDAFGGLFIDRSRAEQSALMLRLRNTSTVVEIARGSLKEVEALRDRLGRDMLGSA